MNGAVQGLAIRTAKSPVINEPAGRYFKLQLTLMTFKNISAKSRNNSAIAATK